MIDTVVVNYQPHQAFRIISRPVYVIAMLMLNADAMMPRAYILNRECMKKTFHVVLSVSLIVILNSLDRGAASAYCCSHPIRLRPLIQISRINILHHNQLISICDSIVRHRTICEPLSASNLFKNYKLNLILRKKKRLKITISNYNFYEPKRYNYDFYSL